MPRGVGTVVKTEQDSRYLCTKLSHYDSFLHNAAAHRNHLEKYGAAAFDRH